MSAGTIVFVHGTGVRLKEFTRSLGDVEVAARRAGIEQQVLPCSWGQSLGVDFEGLSLPEGPSQEALDRDAEEFAQWSWLFQDPLSELEKLTIATPSSQDAWGGAPKWLPTWQLVSRYKPSDELDALLARLGLVEVWPEAWTTILERSEIPRLAFESSGDEYPDARDALTRALAAQLHLCAVARGLPGPSKGARRRLTQILLKDFGGDVAARSGFFSRLLKRAATTMLRNRREQASAVIAQPLGDIILYQTRGQDIRDFIRHKISLAEPPVTLVAHSLGGIASFDLLASANPPVVDKLVTVGSQVPLLFELDALSSLSRKAQLRPDFPRWLNIYDPDDFLSYFAGRLFKDVKDLMVESGQPFPDSHSAYFGSQEVWSAIRDF